jgi:hypothetical protein
MSSFDAFDAMRQFEKDRERRQAMFNRLLADPCMKIPEINDRVLVAAGLLGMGFDWSRLEALVIAVADASIKVRFDKDHYFREQWIHPALIVDVLGPTSE